MRKGFLSKFILAAISLAVLPLSACTSDTHYDSLMTTLSFNLKDPIYQTSAGTAPGSNDLNARGPVVKIYQRIAFDRDMSQVSDFHLHDAWLSKAETPAASNRYNNALPFRSAGVYIYEDADVDKVNGDIFWLTTVDQFRSDDAARLIEMNVGDLRDKYMESNSITVRIDLELDPYKALSYKEAFCDNIEECEMKIDLSLTFEVTD